MSVFKTKADRQVAWLAAFEILVVKMDSKHAGKIEWSSGIHFYNSGMTITEAAKKYVGNRVTTQDRGLYIGLRT